MSETVSSRMPFHVEISAGFHRARVFNLDREDLTATGARAVA